jgi:enoyl-CoA hydratase
MNTFTLTRDGPVAEVRLIGTATGNAMGADFWTELPDLVAALDADDSVRSVILRGEGDLFSVGLDLRWYLVHYRRLMRSGDTTRTRRRLLAEAEAMQSAITSVARSRLPFVAAVHGACVGAGLDLTSACDIRVASLDAYFSLREVRIGVVADLGSLQRLPALIGAGPTRELALTGRDMTAREAYRRGLVTQLAPSAPQLWSRAASLAHELAAYEPHVIAGIKTVLDRGPDLNYVAVWNAAFLPSEELPGRLAAAIQQTAGLQPAELS